MSKDKNTPLEAGGMNVIITGASKGIGKSVSEIYAANGYNLFLCSRGEASLYKAMEDLLNKFPAITIKAKPFDLSVKEQARGFRETPLRLGLNYCRVAATYDTYATDCFGTKGDLSRSSAVLV